jgi:hypothetical protein
MSLQMVLKYLKEILFFDKVLQKERMNTCKQCQFYRKIPMQCSICKCIMPIKTRIAEESCPIQKWIPKSHLWKK